MSVEHREQRPAIGHTQLRSVRLPGQAMHETRSEPAKDIARRLAIAKRERELKERLRG